MVGKVNISSLFPFLNMKNKPEFLKNFNKTYYTTDAYDDYLERFEKQGLDYAERLEKILKPKKILEIFRCRLWNGRDCVSFEKIGIRSSWNRSFVFLS